MGTLRFDDRDGNKNVEKAIGLISQTTTLHVPSRFFQGHPVTVFCKTSVRRRKYCLGFFFACGRLKIS